MTTVREMLTKHANLTKEASAASPAPAAASAAPAASAAAPMSKEAAEAALSTLGFMPIEIAKLAGAIQACAEYEFTEKEASEYLSIPPSVIRAITKVAFEG